MRKTILLLTFLIILPFLILAQEVEVIFPKKACQMLKKRSTYLVDVRSIAEYVFVGHPEKAFNIPITFWNEEKQMLIINDNFIQDIKYRFKENDILIFICRSGNRSLTAAKMVKHAGFLNVYNINEGFEGERDERGYRTVNGWKNRGLPYSYDLKEELIYKFPSHKSIKAE